MTSLRFREQLAAAVPTGHRTLLAAGATWVGAAAGMSGGVPVSALVVAGCAAGLLLFRTPRLGALAVLLVAGALSGTAAAERIERTLGAEVVPGPVDEIATVVADPVPGHAGWDVLLRLPSTTGAVVVRAVARDRPDVVVGDVVAVAGNVRGRAGWLRGDPYGAVVAGADVVPLRPSSSPIVAAGNAIRGVVLERLEPHLEQPAAALLAGFLVGDTTHLPAAHLDELRSSGLTHYVAVSGSNVALFLAAWWIVSGPLPLSPRLRAAGALVALAVFVVATRWEPSVVRASTMAGVVLGGRLLGFPVTAWRALGTAVTLLLLVSGDLAADVGFQLSAGATAGVLVGARLPVARRPPWLWRSLLVTASAQLAVLPVLLLTFGSVPLMSPIANLVAAPLVSAATVIGAVGLATGVGSVLALGLGAAHLVLVVAEHAANWPQLDVRGAVALLGGLLLLRFRVLRPMVAAGATVWLVVAWLPAPPPPWPAITFLDVGQGDAILIQSPGGETALVDGGGDPAALRAALRRAGASGIDVLVATHGDADHVGGLAGLFDRHSVGELWVPDRQERSVLLQETLDAAVVGGVSVVPVFAGHRTRLGEISLEVISPARRFAGENDGSVVLWLEARGATALLTGDVEAVAQVELPAVRPDILQVPHHGSATTNLSWLEATVGRIAVISVGANTFGHPTPVVLDTLAAAAAQTYRTDQDGDVTLQLCVWCGS